MGEPRAADGASAESSDSHASEVVRPYLSVVVPAYREAGVIAATVRRLRRELDGLVDGGFEVLVVDDGSPDDTAAEAEAAGADHVVRLGRNRGKGAAVRAGVAAASGQVIAFTDADLSYAPAQLLPLVERIAAGADVVIGNRRHSGASHINRAAPVREIGSVVFNALTWAVLDGRYRDTQCGLKAFRREAALEVFAHQRLDGFAFDVEVLRLAEQRGARIVEVPTELNSAERSSVRLMVDTFRMVRDLVKVWWWHRRPPPARAVTGLDLGVGLDAADQ